MGMLQQIGAVAVVLALLAATLWLLRRRGLAGVLPSGNAGGRRLERLERLPLGPQHTLHLIRLGDTALLVACSPGGCTLVHSARFRETESLREALP